MLVTAAVFVAAIAANRAPISATAPRPWCAPTRRASAPPNRCCFGDYPYSAAFYRRGRAARITDAAILARRLAAIGPAYVPLAPARLRELPADLRATLRDLGAYGRYQLHFHAPRPRALTRGRIAPETGAPP